MTRLNLASLQLAYFPLVDLEIKLDVFPSSCTYGGCETGDITTEVDKGD